MHPRVKALVTEAASQFGVRPDEIVGPRRRFTDEATRARWYVIRELYDPGSTGNNGSVFVWSKNRIARELGLCHTSVLNALSKIALLQSIGRRKTKRGENRERQ